jgi:hypothetical protein
LARAASAEVYSTRTSTPDSADATSADTMMPFGSPPQAAPRSRPAEDQATAAPGRVRRGEDSSGDGLSVPIGTGDSDNGHGLSRQACGRALPSAHHNRGPMALRRYRGGRIDVTGGGPGWARRLRDGITLGDLPAARAVAEQLPRSAMASFPGLDVPDPWLHLTMRLRRRTGGCRVAHAQSASERLAAVDPWGMAGTRNWTEASSRIRLTAAACSAAGRAATVDVWAQRPATPTRSGHGPSRTQSGRSVAGHRGRGRTGRFPRRGDFVAHVDPSAGPRLAPV